MMQAMRNSAKIVFFLVLVFFAGFMIFQGLVSVFSDPTQGGKAAPQGVIGAVNGEQIPIELFENQYRPRAQELFRQEEEPADEEFVKLRDEVWSNVTTLMIIQQAAAEHGILIADNEVAEYMRQSPPQELFSSPDFQTNEQFDIGKYQTWLQQAATSGNPQILSYLMSFEAQIKQQILVTRLQNFVLSGYRYTTNDAKNDYIKQNEKMKVNYIFLPQDTSFHYEPTDEEIAARYEADKEQYKKAEEAVLSYVQFGIQPSDDDYNIDKATIDSIYQEILNGADFAELAKEHSQDGSAQNGGDLGWFTKGRMVEPFYDGTKALQKINDVSEPVKTQFGWHIIKLTGRRNAEKPVQLGTTPDPEMDIEHKASHILIKTAASKATIEGIQNSARDFISVAEIGGFNETAEEFALSVLETSPFTDGGVIREFGREENIAKFAFSAEIDQISEAFNTRNSIIVCALKEKIPAGFTPLEDVKDRISATILREKRIEKSAEMAQELVSVLAGGRSFSQTAAMAGKSIAETDYFARHEYVKNVGSDPGFTGAAFRLSPENKYSDAVEARSGSYILEYVDFQQADTTIFAANADSLTQDMTYKKRREAWSKWINSIRTDAEIEDYRSFYYGS